MPGAASMPASTKPLTAQFNVRMDAALKKSGDEAFRRAGITPTEAVRMLWECASRSTVDTNKILEFLKPEKSDQELEEEEAERRRRMELARRGPQAVEDFYRERGIPWPPQSDPITDDDLRELMFEERFGSWDS